MIAAVASFFAGLAIHLFGLVNVLHNYDNIAVSYGCGTGIESGRWFLTVLEQMLDKQKLIYNVPWMCGVVSLFILAIAVYYIVRIFDIRSRLLAALAGMICVSFPTITSTLMFKYTAIYYSFAILLSVLAAYVVINAKGKFVLSAILSALMTACALGIYQAYLPLTTSIFVLYLIQQALIGNDSWKKLLYQGLYDCLCLILGLVVYFVLLQVCLKVYDAQLSGYQGIDSMGSLSIREIPGLVVHAFTSFWLMPAQNLYSLAPNGLLSVSYQVVTLMSMVMGGFILIRKKASPLLMMLTVVLYGVFPIAVCLIEIMCPNSWIYTLMVYSFVLVLLAPMVVYEALPDAEEKWLQAKRLCKKIIIVVLAVVIYCYSYFANVNYLSMYYMNRQTENYFTSMVAQIRMTEGFTADKKWAFIGNIQDPLIQNRWQTGPFYGGHADTMRLLNSYSRSTWLQDYIGYAYQFVDSSTQSALAETDTVKEMPCWPDYGSIQVVDDVVVIKFSE